MQIETGSGNALGAIFDGEGTNFALFSEHAERVELCLYDATGEHETARVELPDKTNDVWHGYIPELAPGTAYGYRVYGPYELHSGFRFNPHKLLLDPYARQLVGEFSWHESHYAYDRNARAQDLSFDQHDNARHMPKGVVTRAGRPSLRPARALTPWHQSVIYETHVRGFTISHPELPEPIRGSFAGLSHPRIIDYIKSLGITSIELLPVHSFIDEPFLKDKGLTNYWGYNTLNFFCAHSAYLGGAGIEGFREFVDRYHDAGLEVILDVVYNHTAEGNELGPTLSFRGIDNLSYYHLSPADKRFYVNDSGCGNTLNMRHPRVMQLVLDSLRYWSGELGVDGFRFDLATVLGREERGFNTNASFFQALAQDPVLSGCKFIAEPWDLGIDGYQLGHFPSIFSEWNDRYRDTVRRFWRGDAGQLPELARRLHGSGDIFEHRGRRPYASINLITSHDGFTLRDLVSYNHRDNSANLEDNNDGHRENLSFNHGHEGPTDDAEINKLRLRQQRNLLATLIVSQGVPMLLSGDEMGRSQGGNNNAYCQDNAISWIDWSAIDSDAENLIAFTRKLLALRQSFPVLQANRFRHQAENLDDDSIRWINSDGKLMREAHWHERDNHALGYLLTERNNGDRESRLLLVLLNASIEPQDFILPPGADSKWLLLIDTCHDDIEAEPVALAPASKLTLAGKSLQIYSADSSQ